MKNMIVEKPRISSLDLFKGILAILMVLDHAGKLFQLENEFSINLFTWIGDLSVFPGLLLAFGFVTQRVYFSDQDQIPTKRIAKTICKILVAYFISALLFRLLVNPARIDIGIIYRIITFSDIPSYSEFLLTFGITLLLATIFARPIQYFISNLHFLFILLVAIFLTTLIPYGRITSPHIGLLIGTKEFTSFPVLQYSIFFLLGMHFARAGYSQDFWFILAIIGFFLLAIFRLFIGPPERFPPSPIWILGSYSIVFTIFLLSQISDRFRAYTKWIEFHGKHVLAVLLVSNVVLFSILGLRPSWLPQPWILFASIILIMLTVGLSGRRFHDTIRRNRRMIDKSARNNQIDSLTTN